MLQLYIFFTIQATLETAPRNADVAKRYGKEVKTFQEELKQFLFVLGTATDDCENFKEPEYLQRKWVVRHRSLTYLRN